MLYGANERAGGYTRKYRCQQNRIAGSGTWRGRYRCFEQACKSSAFVVKYAYIFLCDGKCFRTPRPVSWVSAARKAFDAFPAGARLACHDALTIAAVGGKSPIAKPLTGMGPGVLEIALPFEGNAFRVVYAVKIGAELWVLHAFQKKSPQGIKTPKHEIDLIKDRLKRLKEMLR